MIAEAAAEHDASRASLAKKLAGFGIDILNLHPTKKRRGWFEYYGNIDRNVAVHPAVFKRFPFPRILKVHGHVDFAGQPLQTLEGMPEEVDALYLEGCPIKNLVGAPRIVHKNVSAETCRQLSSLEGVGVVGDTLYVRETLIPVDVEKPASVHKLVTGRHGQAHAAAEALPPVRTFVQEVQELNEKPFPKTIGGVKYTVHVHAQKYQSTDRRYSTLSVIIKLKFDAGTVELFASTDNNIISFGSPEVSGRVHSELLEDPWLSFTRGKTIRGLKHLLEVLFEFLEQPAVALRLKKYARNTASAAAEPEHQGYGLDPDENPAFESAAIADRIEYLLDKKHVLDVHSTRTTGTAKASDSTFSDYSDGSWEVGWYIQHPFVPDSCNFFISFCVTAHGRIHVQNGFDHIDDKREIKLFNSLKLSWKELDVITTFDVKRVRTPDDVIKLLHRHVKPKIQELLNKLDDKMLKTAVAAAEPTPHFPMKEHLRYLGLEVDKLDVVPGRPGVYDYHGDVLWAEFDLKKFPVRFRRVHGHFAVNGNHLTSLRGGPEFVDGTYECHKNPLTSLEGAPKRVGLFFNAEGVPVTTLDGFDTEVRGDVYLGGSRITSISGSKARIGGNLRLNDTNLRNLDGFEGTVAVNLIISRTPCAAAWHATSEKPAWLTGYIHSNNAVLAAAEPVPQRDVSWACTFTAQDHGGHYDKLMTVLRSTSGLDDVYEYKSKRGGLNPTACTCCVSFSNRPSIIVKKLESIWFDLKKQHVRALLKFRDPDTANAQVQAETTNDFPVLALTQSVESSK